MTAPWATYPGAPAPGTRLCRAADVPAPGTLAVDVDGFAVLIVRTGAEPVAFVNACPHQYLPLTHRGAGVLSADGTKLICTNHDAVFDAATGAGLGGYGAGCELDAVPVEIDANGFLVISK